MELVIKNLSKSYKKKETVKNIDAVLSPGIWGLHLKFRKKVFFDQ